MINKEVKLIKPENNIWVAKELNIMLGYLEKLLALKKFAWIFYQCHQEFTLYPHIHKEIETIAYLLEGECTLFYGKVENHILVKKGEQIFIPENIPHTPFNQSKNDCIWVVVHSSGDDQDELISMPELAKELEKHKGKSEVETIEIKSKPQTYYQNKTYIESWIIFLKCIKLFVIVSVWLLQKELLLFFFN